MYGSSTAGLLHEVGFIFLELIFVLLQQIHGLPTLPCQKMASVDTSEGAWETDTFTQCSWKVSSSYEGKPKTDKKTQGLKALTGKMLRV